MDRAKLAELRKKKADAKRAEHREMLDSNESIVEAIKELDKSINGKVNFDAERLFNQLEEFKQVGSLSKSISSLEQSIKKLSDNKKADLAAIIEKVGGTRDVAIADAIAALKDSIQEKVVDQNPSDFTPVRRVRMVAGKLVFDDEPLQVRVSGGSGGGFPNRVISPDDQIYVIDPRFQFEGGKLKTTGDVTIEGDVIVDNVGIENVEGNKIDPATEDKQDDIITAIGGIVTGIIGDASKTLSDLWDKLVSIANGTATLYKQIEAANDNITTVNYTDATKTEVASITQSSVSVGAEATETFDDSGETTLVITRGVE
jgi:tetratricopeptide (TPR) repeat protein